MKTALIVHGARNNASGNWFPWIKNELEKKGFLAIVPDFPTPKNQTLQQWLKVFNEHEKRLDEHSIVVGHSLGVAFLLNILERRKFSAAFFVSGVGGKVDNEFWENMKSFAERNLIGRRSEHIAPIFVCIIQITIHISLCLMQKFWQKISERI